MEQPNCTFLSCWRYFILVAAGFILMFAASSAGNAQAKGQTQPPAKPRARQQAKPPQPKPEAKTPEAMLAELMQKYPGLLEEFGVLFEKLQHNLQFPPARGESRILPLLPGGTTGYAAFPNYGEVTRQALRLFHDELQQSAVLRDWWQRGDTATSGPRLEAALEKFAELSQYLGEEIVVSGATQERQAGGLLVVEIRKPGLKPFLEQLVKEYATGTKTDIRILEPPELATARDPGPGNSVLVLVRPELVAAAADVATLRRFNARLEQGSREFASTAFGKRVLQAYRGGASMLAAADLQKMVAQVPITNKQDLLTFQRSGFADMEYAVWEHKSVAGQPSSQGEVSFIAPRHGIASWLAAPAPLGSLDFVSPSAIMTATLVLKNPAEIFDDVKELSPPPNPTYAKLAQWEQAVHISLQDDLLRPLAGEITLELDSVAPPEPVWKAILRVNDPARFQGALNTMLMSMNMIPEQWREDGVVYYALPVPSGKQPTRIGYALVDGYLIVASSPAMAAEAARLHRNGRSLAKSKKFLEALPPGQPAGASGLLYQDPIAMAALQLQRMAPGLAASVAQSAGQAPPNVLCFYGSEKAIREASTSVTADAAVVLVAAAIAIPNLLRSRTAANEASAVAAIRSVSTAQVVYQSYYPEKGFAPSLEMLGPNPRSPSTTSAAHASLLDATLGCADMWCTREGYRFTITAACRQQHCGDYVIVATPLSPSSGSRNFCSTSNGIVHFKAGPPLTAPVTAVECRSWTSLQ
ncbi:MAG TPA: hypothetical protein VMS96_12955 [Terriglobales bacterium]|nr:hypothetical protein [Terriglobales bacterium]